MTADQIEKMVASITAGFAKAIKPVVLRLKSVEEELRDGGAEVRALRERVKALEQQQK